MVKHTRQLLDNTLDRSLKHWDKQLKTPRHYGLSFRRRRHALIQFFPSPPSPIASVCKAFSWTVIWKTWMLVLTFLSILHEGGEKRIIYSACNTLTPGCFFRAQQFVYVAQYTSCIPVSRKSDVLSLPLNGKYHRLTKAAHRGVWLVVSKNRRYT